MTTEQQTSTTVSLTTATTQAPVTTVPSNTPVSGSEIPLGSDTMPSNSPPHAHVSATYSGFLVPVSAIDQEPSGDAALQTNSTNVLGAQSSAFSLSHLPLPAPDVPVTAEQLQAVRLWLQQATANFNQRLNVGQCVSQPESVSQTTRDDIPRSQIDTTAHLAHTSVRSRATLFSPRNSATTSAHGRNFVVKCGRGSAWCKTNIDIRSMRKWSFVNTDSQSCFLECCFVASKQHSPFALSLQMIYKLINLILLLDMVL